MNPFKRSILSAVLLAAGVTLLTGCGGVQLEPGEDPIVVRAEQTIDGAQATIIHFLTHEHKFRDVYRAEFPHVHGWAEGLRVKIPNTGERVYEAAIKNARGTLLAYKQSKSQPDADALDVAIAVLQDIVVQAGKYELLVKEG